MTEMNDLPLPFEISMSFDDTWEPFGEIEASLPRYLEARERVIRSGSGDGIEDWNTYKQSLDRHLGRLGDFLASDETNLQNLVYGNIQSGKTAHLLANICWAKDFGLDIVILFSGSTTPLNDQTYARLKADLPTGTAQVDMVPTETATLALDSLSSELMNSITSRLDNPHQAIPIVVMLKNPNRLAAMINLINSLNARFHKKLTVMVIDDEADQSSPDGTVRPNNRARLARRTTHGSISELLATIQGKIIYLAYTATPQALMVGEIQNQLHPRFCTVIPAGREYFGIKEAVNSPDSMVDTFKVSKMPQGTPEEEINYKALQHMFAEFLLLTWIHREHKEIFHTDHMGNSLKCNRDSLQFLIHPSSAQAEHSKYYGWVKGLKESWLDMLTSPLQRKKLLTEFIEPAFKNVLSRFTLEEQRLLGTRENQESCLRHIVKGLSAAGAIELKLVNSDERKKLKNIGTEREFLPDDERGEWEGKDWILIGGDILGRGLTIPHLTTTVFLRDPNQPNFDVAMQQMRFLGYRKSYERVIRVCAPLQVLDDYQDAAIISTLSRRRAEIWDISNRDLILNPDPIIFQAPDGARFRPTRNNVTSVDVNRKQISRTGFFSLSRIVNPEHFDNNLKVLQSLPGITFESLENDKWQIFRMNSKDLLELLKKFTVSRDDNYDFEPFLELLSFDNANFGLAEKNVSFLLDKDFSLDTASEFRTKFDLSDRGSLPFQHRGRSVMKTDNAIFGTKLKEWESCTNPSQFDSYKVKAIVGDSERKVADFEPESVRVHARIYGLYQDADTFTNPVGWGLSLIGWTPLTGTQMWIHQGAINV